MQTKIKRVRKALVSAAAAAVAAFGAGMAEGGDWRAAAGMAGAAAILAGFATYGVGNKLGAAELEKQAVEAARQGRR